jgi:purine-binding chemotaxis protein CheW
MQAMAHHQEPTTTAGTSGQLITCTLGSAEYGIEIMAVQEIKGWAPTTSIPRAPSWIRGVINLRGVIVPILDLRARFGQPATEPTAMHVVVIVQAAGRTFGILVDAVSDIISVAPEDVRPVPEMGSSLEEKLLSGLVPMDRGMVALVSLDALVAMPDEAAQALAVAAPSVH